MVNPSRRSGQRRSLISHRTIRGKFGAKSTPSPATAANPATPVTAAARRNWRLVLKRDSKRGRDGSRRSGSLYFIMARGLETESGNQIDAAVRRRIRE